VDKEEEKGEGMDILNVHPAAPKKENRPKGKEGNKAREVAAKWAEPKHAIIYFRTRLQGFQS
jgi:hypothetical protein